MDLKSLGSRTMVALSVPWTDETKDKPLLLSIPLVAPLVGELTLAHESLLSIHETVSSMKERLKILIQKSLRFDRAFDLLYRGAYGVLTDAADLEEDEAARAEILAKRDELMPDGLAVINSTYLNEVGTVEMLEEKMTEEIRTFLDGFVINNVTLTRKIDRLIERGKALGESERERAQLETQKDGTQITKADVLRARYRWIQVVQALISLLDIAPDVSDETKNRILQPLLREEAKQSRRTSTADDEELDDLLDVSDAEIATGETEA